MLQIVAWQSGVRLRYGDCAHRSLRFIYSLFSLFCFAWCHSGLCDIKGSFQLCRRSDAQQETSPAVCVSLASCLSGTSCLGRRGERNVRFLSVAPASTYRMHVFLCVEHRQACFYAVLLSLSCSLSGNPPPSLHPAAGPGLNTCGAIPPCWGAAPSPSPGFPSCQLTKWIPLKLANNSRNIMKNKPNSLRSIPNILRGPSIPLTISPSLRD